MNILRLVIVLICCSPLIVYEFINIYIFNLPESDFYLAIKSSDLVSAKRYLTNDNINLHNGAFQDTALNAAVRNNDYLTTKFLIDNGVNVNPKHRALKSALHIAAYNACDHHNNTDILKLLLDNGADVNISDSQGRTPIFATINCENPSVVPLFVQHGAKVNIRPEGERSLLLEAIYMNINNRNSSVIAKYIEYGANPYILNPKENKSAISVAQEYRLGVEKILLRSKSQQQVQVFEKVNFYNRKEILRGICIHDYLKNEGITISQSFASSVSKSYGLLYFLPSVLLFVIGLLTKKMFYYISAIAIPCSIPILLFVYLLIAGTGS